MSIRAPIVYTCASLRSLHSIEELITLREYRNVVAADDIGIVILPNVDDSDFLLVSLKSFQNSDIKVKVVL